MNLLPRSHTLFVGTMSPTLKCICSPNVKMGKNMEGKLCIFKGLCGHSFSLHTNECCNSLNLFSASPGHYNLSQTVLICPQVSYTSHQFPLEKETGLYLWHPSLRGLWACSFLFKTPGLEIHREKTLPILSYRWWLCWHTVLILSIQPVSLLLSFSFSPAS